MQSARKVLIRDDQPEYREFLRQLVEMNEDVHVSGVAVNACASPDNVVAAELRTILDGCPICDGGFRDHMYFMLASVVVERTPDSFRHLAHFLECLRECRWQELLAFQESSRSNDVAVAFAFRCDKGRVGIVMVLSPADPALPDEPVQFTILSTHEGRRLLVAIKAEQWLPLRPPRHPQN